MARFSIFGLLAVLFVTGCGNETSSYKINAKGAPYEIVVVADHDVWNGPAGDTLRAMFYKQFPMVNRQETTFDVLRVLPSGFKKLNMQHRNVLIADIDTAYHKPYLGLARDVYAKPQIVLSAKAADAASLVELIDSNRDDIMLMLEAAEKDRDVAAAMRHTPEAISKLIKEKFGFEMSMGPGYEIQKMQDQSDDFLWLAYRMPIADQGIIIYTYPFSGAQDFERDNLIRRRDEFVARIPGENPGSYMATNHDFIGLTYKKIDGRPWAEMRGLWDVTGDFMGGPYRNYSTLDEENQRIIAIDFYVLSPDPHLSQRNYIKQLEHFLYTVKIPGKTPEPEIN